MMSLRGIEGEKTAHQCRFDVDASRHSGDYQPIFPQRQV
jgi:hypothetical protein